MASLAESLKALDRQDRIDALISVAERFVNEPNHPEEARVPGCESEAFVWSETAPNGMMNLHFAVENPQGISAMALATLLKEVTAGASIPSIAEIPESVVFELFGDELSMGKTMGLTGMVKMVAGEAKKRL